MKAKLLTTKCECITFYKKYFIIVSNNGNHSGYNRKWNIESFGYKTMLDAKKAKRAVIVNDAEVENGLKYVRIVNPEDIINIIESEERIDFSGCLEILKINYELLVEKGEKLSTSPDSDYLSYKYSGITFVVQSSCKCVIGALKASYLN